MAQKHRPDSPAASAPTPPHDPLFDGIEPAAPQVCPECGANHPPSQPHVAAALKPSVEASATAITRRSSVTGEQEVELSRQSEVVGAQIKATIAARTLTAHQRPRSFDDARAAILRDCRRPGFAEKAVYSLPPRGGEGGKRIEGLSVRFAEAALAHWTNVSVSSHVISDDEKKRVVRVCVADLEANYPLERDITVSKQVERRTVRPGQVIVSQRLNNENKPVYVVQATEEEVNMNEARERSRVLRNEGLRLLPPDVKEEAFRICRETNAVEDAKDPDSARNKVADGFMELGVRPSDLEAYLGCPVKQASPAQVADLREIYLAVSEGISTWNDILAARADDLAPSEEQAKGGGAIADIKERARQKAEERKAVKNGGSR